MTEAAMIEAVRAVGGAGARQMDPSQMAPAVADPAAVDAFQAAMASGGVEKPTAIPFADRVAAAWRTAQGNEQLHLRRMQSIVESGDRRMQSSLEMINLQYELATMKFNLDMTLTVAKKVSDAVTTLVKNG